MGGDSEELRRLRGRPSAVDAVGVVAFRIEPYGDIERLARRLREVVSAAVQLSEGEDFTGEVLGDAGVPAWFSAVCESGQAPLAGVPTEVLAGVKRYVDVRAESRWDLQEWLFCFDPELRRWRWWDLTSLDGRSACLWIDTQGESAVPCEELYWAAFAAGAQDVVMMPGLPWARWAEQATIGIA